MARISSLMREARSYKHFQAGLMSDGHQETANDAKELSGTPMANCHNNRPNPSQDTHPLKDYLDDSHSIVKHDLQLCQAPSVQQLPLRRCCQLKEKAKAALCQACAPSQDQVLSMPECKTQTGISAPLQIIFHNPTVCI